MTVIKTNIDRLFSLVNDFNEFSIEYQKIIDDFFELMEKMPNANEDWINYDANKFVDYCKAEKTAFNLVGEEFKNYTNLLDNTANLLLKASDEILK